MNFFNESDPLGLKKLDKEFSKIFKSDKIKTGVIGDPSMGKSKRWKVEQKKQVSNVDIVKAMFKYAREIVNFLYKFATRNNIPKDIDEIIRMEESLDKAQIQKAEAERAIIRIKQLQAQEKAFRKQERQIMINKIKNIRPIKYLNTHPRALVLVLFGGTAIIINIIYVLFPR